MTTTAKIVATLTLAAVAHLGAARSADAACPDSPGALEICVFDGAHFTGGFGVMTRGWTSAACGLIAGTYFNSSCFPSGVGNDTIGSIKVGANARARICKNSSYGSCTNILPGDWFDLGSWNNAISSIRIDWTDQSCQDGSSWPVFPGETSVHIDANQSGDCTTKDVGDYLHSGVIGLVDNTISSVRVGPSTQVTLCRNTNLGSPCAAFINTSESSGSNANLAGSIVGDNQTSSVSVTNN